MRWYCVSTFGPRWLALMLLAVRFRNALRPPRSGLSMLASGASALGRLVVTNPLVSRLFSSIFVDQSAHHKEQLLKHFVAIVAKAKQLPGCARCLFPEVVPSCCFASGGLTSAVVCNIAAAILRICRELTLRDM
jgi:hypothetical protein